MNPIYQTAKNIHYGLLHGLCVLNDCIDFADNFIANHSQIPNSIIELSLSNNKYDALQAIWPIAEKADHLEAIRFALGRMHYLGLHDPKRLADFASILFQEAISMEFNIPKEFELFMIDHEYEIAEVMGWDNESANQTFMEALAFFKRENSHKADWFVVT